MQAGASATHTDRFTRQLAMQLMHSQLCLVELSEPNKAWLKESHGIATVKDLKLRCWLLSMTVRTIQGQSLAESEYR